MTVDDVLLRVNTDQLAILSAVVRYNCSSDNQCCNYAPAHRACSDASTHSSWLVVRWTSPAARSVCGVVWSHAGRMPCVAADNDCQMTDSSLTCDNHITTRRHSDRLTPYVAAASKTSSSSTSSSACLRLPMWRSLSSLWKKSSSNAVTRSTSAGAPAVDTPSETQPCSFVRNLHFVSPLMVSKEPLLAVQWRI